jgi:hypothetical protein
VVPKISPARESARSCFQYDIAKKYDQPRGEWIAGNLMGTPRQMAKMAGTYRALRPDCKKPVWRCSISLPPSDGRPSQQKWAEIAHDFLREMGIPADAAWCAVHHGEVDHDHIHITLLRTLPDGTLWSEERSAKRAIKACAALEARHQLASHDRTPKPKNAPTRAETEIFKRQQKKGKPAMSREIIQAAVDQVLADYPPPKGIDFVDLQRLLASLKPPIDLQASMPKGIFRGVSYQCDGFKWPGSKIGREYSVGLVERGVRMPTTKTGVIQPPEIADPCLNQVEQPAPQAADKYSRAPAPLRQMLREQHQQRQLVPTPKPATEAQTTKRGWDIDLAEIDRATRDLGPLSRAMALLGSACIKYSLSFLKTLISWIKRLLAKFGFGVAERPQRLASGQQAGAYEPYVFEGESGDVSDAEAAVQLVEQITAALEAKDADLLPDVEGRDQIAAMMADEGAATGAAAASAAAPAPAADPFDDMFSGEGAAPDTEQVDALASLQAAGTEYLRARQALLKASSKPPERPDFVPVAQQALNRAALAQREAQEQFDRFRHDHPVKSRVYESDEKQKLERASAEVARLKIELATEQRRTAENQKIHDALPTPKPSAAVVATTGAALIEYETAFEKAQQRFAAEVAHVVDPVLKAQLELKLKKASSKFAFLPIEGRPETLNAGIELVREARREAAADLARRMAVRPGESEIAVDDEMIDAQR